MSRAAARGTGSRSAATVGAAEPCAGGTGVRWCRGSSDPALTPPLAWPGRYSPEQLATAVQVVRRMVQRGRSGGLREAVPDYCTPVWIQEADPVPDAAEEFLASWRGKR